MSATMAAQFAHWTEDDIRRAFDYHGLSLARISKMTGRDIAGIREVLLIGKANSNNTER